MIGTVKVGWYCIWWRHSEVMIGLTLPFLQIDQEPSPDGLKHDLGPSKAETNPLFRNWGFLSIVFCLLKTVGGGCQFVGLEL